MTAEVHAVGAVAYLIRTATTATASSSQGHAPAGYLLEQALASGIMSMASTWRWSAAADPAIANITTSMRADAGAVISASHNRIRTNASSSSGVTASRLRRDEGKIEALIADEIDRSPADATKIAGAVRLDDAGGPHRDSQEPFPRSRSRGSPHRRLRERRAYKVLPHVLEEVTARRSSARRHPNGRNINDKCGALYPQGLAAAVLKNEAHLGIAVDGDGGPLIVVDEKRGRLRRRDHGDLHGVSWCGEDAVEEDARPRR